MQQPKKNNNGKKWGHKKCILFIDVIRAQIQRQENEIFTSSKSLQCNSKMTTHTHTKALKLNATHTQQQKLRW